MKYRGKTRRTIDKENANKKAKQFRKHEAFMERTGKTLEGTHVYFRSLARKHKKAKTLAIQKKNKSDRLNSQQRRELRRKAERAAIKAIFNSMPLPVEVVELQQEVA